MDQLDEDDFEAMDDIEEEEGEQTNNRGTWHSGWGSEARDSVASLGTRLRNTKGNVDASRESNLSAMTFKSQSSDTFHYSVRSPVLASSSIPESANHIVPLDVRIDAISDRSLLST